MIYLLCIGLGQTWKHSRPWCKETWGLGRGHGWRVGATHDPQPWIQGGLKLLIAWDRAPLNSVFSAFAAKWILSVLQGEWKPKQIDNPNYKGPWVHPEIDNPEYSPDSNIYKFDNIAVLGLDLWQVRRRRDHLLTILSLVWCLSYNLTLFISGEIWYHLWQLLDCWRCEGSGGHWKWDMGRDKGMSFKPQSVCKM